MDVVEFVRPDKAVDGSTTPTRHLVEIRAVQVIGG